MKKLTTILTAALFLAIGTQYTQAGVSIPANTHWKCYSVVGNAPSPTETVTLEDQFSLSTETVRRPRLVCNPVDKNDEDTDETDVHLTCYETVSSTKLSLAPRVQVGNQFVNSQTLQVVDNPLQLVLVPGGQGVTGTTGFTPQGQTVRSSHLLCVPSTKSCVNNLGQPILCPNED